MLELLTFCFGFFWTLVLFRKHWLESPNLIVGLALSIGILFALTANSIDMEPAYKEVPVKKVALRKMT